MDQINELSWLEVDHNSKKIRNYKTGLMVSWEGKTGQALLKSAKALIHPSQVPWHSSSPFDNQKIKNPYTNNMVNWYGDLGQDILKEAIALGPPTDSDIPIDVVEIISKHLKDSKDVDDCETNDTLRSLSKLFRSVLVGDIDKLKACGNFLKRAIVELYAMREDSRLTISFGSVLDGGREKEECILRSYRSRGYVAIQIGRSTRKVAKIPGADLFGPYATPSLDLKLKKFMNNTGANQLVPMFRSMTSESFDVFPKYKRVIENGQMTMANVTLQSVEEWKEFLKE